MLIIQASDDSGFHITMEVWVRGGSFWDMGGLVRQSATACYSGVGLLRGSSDLVPRVINKV